ncbi:chaperonin [Culex quinquefasciatus]|uniref:Chaperonin n=1 Tax=Culex quinquefasciatus TaxID=7176 RepID=B0X8N5_CULQU|nr:chaperonin [Culex quinquefasciatus]|eukprot:XP_001866007.1 chaperonin [Culex quinquefasciatus]
MVQVVIARLSSFVGAMAIGNLVKSTPVPKEMDKILIAHGRSAGQVEVTNDGATILSGRRGHEVIARLSSFVGAMAIGNLVKSTPVPKEMDKILIAHGRSAGQVEVTNDGATILKAVGVDMSRFQDDELEDSVPANLFAGCCLEDSFLDEGFLLDKKTVVHKPKRIENAKILIANTPMDTDKIKVFGSNKKVNDGEDCRAGGRREGEDEGQGDNQNQARRCDLFESLHRCDSPFQHPQDRNISQGGKLLPNSNFAPKW